MLSPPTVSELRENFLEQRFVEAEGQPYGIRIGPFLIDRMPYPPCRGVPALLFAHLILVRLGVDLARHDTFDGVMAVPMKSRTPLVVFAAVLLLVPAGGAVYFVSQAKPPETLARIAVGETPSTVDVTVPRQGRIQFWADLDISQPWYENDLRYDLVVRSNGTVLERLRCDPYESRFSRNRETVGSRIKGEFEMNDCAVSANPGSKLTVRGRVDVLDEDVGTIHKSHLLVRP